MFSARWTLPFSVTAVIGSHPVVCDGNQRGRRFGDVFWRSRNPMRRPQTTLECASRGALVGALLALAGVSPPATAQQVYKSVDGAGHVVYSDRGSTKDAAKTSVRVNEPDPAEVARLAKEQEVLNAAELARERQQATDDKNKTTEEHRKAVACQSARNNYHRVRDLNRIYQDDAAGNRRWYSDEEADALKEHARQAMTAACGS
jgi:hypothetical protein